MDILTKEIQSNVLSILENKIHRKPHLSFDKYQTNKSQFYQDLGNQLIVSRQFDASINLQEKYNLFEDFSRSLSHKLGGFGYLKAIQLLDVNGIEGFCENKIERDVVIGNIKLKKGMKLSKGLIQVLSQDYNDFAINETINSYSTYRSKMKLSGILSLSIHPLDYLSMSLNNSGWRSCHALDGEYAAGTLSLMFDKVTLVAYIANSNSEYLNEGFCMEWNSKKWRALIHIDSSRNRFVISKHYPFYSSVAETEIIKLLKEIYPHMVQYESSQMSESEVTSAVGNVKNKIHFCDVRAHTMSHPVVQLYSKNENTERIIVGASIPCLHCGDHNIIESMEFACDNCRLGSTCDICGNAYNSEDLYWVECDDNSVCDNCFAHNYVTCDCCSDVQRPDNMNYTRNNRWHCDNCYDPEEE